MVLSHPLGPFRAIQRVRDRRVSLMLDFSAAEIEAVRLSLRIAFWAVVGSLPFGLATAIVLARGRFYGKSLLDGVVHLPLVMPPVVTGYLLLLPETAESRGPAVGSPSRRRRVPPLSVMGRAELYPLAGRFEAGAVFEVHITAHDPRWSLTELTGDFRRLTVPRLDAPVGTALRGHSPHRHQCTQRVGGRSRPAGTDR